MYVVLGATGKTGSVVANALLAAGKPLRVVVRSADKGAAWKARGADVAIADVEDAAALTAAFRGASGVYGLLPPDLAAPDVLARARRIAGALAQAADGAAVPHLVLLSSIGGHLPEGTGIVQTLHHAERRLGEIRGRLTVLRPGYFIENWGAVLPVAQQNGILPTPLTLTNKIIMIGSPDIGVVASQELQAPSGPQRKVIELAGPEELSPNDVAARLGKVLGKSINAVPVSIDDFGKTLMGFGASADTARLYGGLVDSLNKGIGPEGGSVPLVRGKTTAEEVFAGMLRR